ncbi:protein EARLY FLOWERING 4 [Solanum verrucosum]|nr:protein EARLY FLOWERING 4 [Solanum verrucosum]
MEDTFKLHRQTLAKPQSLTTNDRRRPHDNGDLSIEEGNSEMWNNFSNRFRQVQSVLDRNRSLIQQVNENHQSRTNDNMVQNVNLIQELNGNISKVVSLYSDISTNFSTMFGQENDAIRDETKSRRHH